MKRRIFGLLIVMAGICLMGCAKATDSATVATSAAATVNTVDAKATFAVVQKIVGYSNPQNLAAAGITTTSVNAAANDQTATSTDGTYKIRITTASVDFSNYPQDRTYTITLNSFRDATSGYTLTGTITVKATFSATAGTGGTGSSVSTSNMSQVFSLTLTGGTIGKISTTGLTQSTTSSAIVGTVVCDNASFNVADLK